MEGIQDTHASFFLDIKQTHDLIQLTASDYVTNDNTCLSKKAFLLKKNKTDFKNFIVYTNQKVINNFYYYFREKKNY